MAHFSVVLDVESPRPIPRVKVPWMIARTVAEAHLFMDIAGAAPGKRGHQLKAAGDTLVSVYHCETDRGVRAFEFVVEATEIDGGAFGGEAPSRLLGPAQFLLESDRLTREVPGSPDGLDSTQRAAAQRRLNRAALCLDEVLKFFTDGKGRLSLGDMRTVTGGHLYRREPGRFDRARVEVVAQTYRKLAAAMD